MLGCRTHWFQFKGMDILSQCVSKVNTKWYLATAIPLKKTTTRYWTEVLPEVLVCMSVCLYLCMCAVCNHTHYFLDGAFWGLFPLKATCTALSQCIWG